MLPRPSARLLRSARVPAASVLAGALAVGGLLASTAEPRKQVAVEVDGRIHEIQTRAATVDEVLEELEVPVGPADEVLPDPAAEVVDGLSIEVERAITVRIEVDGAGIARRVTAPVTSVAGVLEEAGMEDLEQRGARIDPAPTAPIEDGDIVRVSLPTQIVLAVDGFELAFDTFADDVRGVLEQAGTEIGSDDIVWPAKASTLVGPTVIRVTRVDIDEEVEEVALPYEEERRTTNELNRGTTRVAQEGQEGRRLDVYRLTVVDGEQVERELIDQEVVREPTNRIVLVGTYDPPPPPPPPPPPSGGTSHWDALARCESGGNWAHSGGRYHGGLQFHPQTWSAHKLSGYPQYAYQATREQQIAVGERVQRSQGWGAWPHCSRVVGLR